MNTHRARLPFLGLVGVWMAAHVSYAPAETVNCTAIRTIPTQITSSGVYCLTRNVRTITSIPGNTAILIQVSDVIIDLNGFTLLGPGLPDAFDTGIGCTNCRRVTIKNGTIQGFDTAVLLGALLPSTSSANVIEDIRAFRNTRLGIVVTGHGNIVRNNLVVNTDGSNNGAERIGIQAQGTSNRILNNDIATVGLTGIGRGIYIVTGDGLFDRPPDNLVVGNRITDAALGIVFFESDGKFRDNLTMGVATPYVGGTNAGNNN